MTRSNDKHNLSLVYLPPGSLSPHPDNPRVHRAKQIAQIAKSIEAFGFRIPVVIDERNRIVCGHARVQAALKLKLNQIPVLRTSDLNDAQMRAFMVADNRLAENAEWDERLLARNFEVLSELKLDFDLEVTGFEYGQIEQLVEIEHSANDESDETFPEKPPAICKLDDLWQLGAHRLLCADSTNPASFERLTGGQKATIAFTDPPYNVSAKHIGRVCAKRHGDFGQAAGEMTPDEFVAFLSKVMALMCAHSQDGSIHYLCMDWRHAGQMLAAGYARYSELKNICVWSKDRAGMGSFYRSQHELVFVWKNGDARHQNNFELGQYGRNRSNLWPYPSAQSMREADGDPGHGEALSLHPTVKPVRMIADALRDCSRRGEVVLDPFAGSGSTIIAAEKTRRICYAIELDPQYCDVVIARWEAWTGQKAVLGSPRPRFRVRIPRGVA